MSTRAVTARGWRVLIAILAAYADITVYGFHFGLYNHRIQLPMVEWLMNPALYPGDPVTESFRHFPSVFWELVAFGARWIDVEALLFLLFVVTKVLFFGGVVRLLASFTANLPLLAVMCVAAALSPSLNQSILEATQTQSSLAVVIVFWAIVLANERRWVAAGLLLGLATFVNALYVAYALFALVPLAWRDWKLQPRTILLGGGLFAGLFVLWASSSRGVMPQNYPPSFLETLWIIYPKLFSIRSLELQLLGRTLVGVAVLTAAMRRVGVERCTRFELLTLGFLIPFCLGAVIGEFVPVPQLWRIQFLRAETFLVSLGAFWIQGYGARLLIHSDPARPAATILVGALAILFPLSDGPLLAAMLCVGALLLAEPMRIYDRLNSWLAQRSAASQSAIVVIGGALASVALFVAGGSPVRLGGLAALGAGFGYYALQRAHNQIPLWRLAAGATAVAVVWAGVEAVPAWSRLWDPIRRPDAMTAAWWDVQKWARASTPIEAIFLVPPEPGGFRAFSQRPIWTERKDHDIIFTHAEYADTWRSRMASIGVTLQVGLYIPSPRMIELYKARSWDELDALARREHLDYIVQFSDVHYAVTPEYANEWFAAYRVSP